MEMTPRCGQHEKLEVELTQFKNKVEEVHTALLGTLEKEGFIRKVEVHIKEIQDLMTQFSSLKTDYYKLKTTVTIIKWPMYILAPVILTGAAYIIWLLIIGDATLTMGGGK